MWLASVSLRRPSGRVVPTGKWAKAGQLRAAERLIDSVLDGVGDVTREREFRMCVTVCRHRALTQEEFEALPQWWHDAPALDLAGGPLAVIWHKGIPEAESVMPCEKPGRRPIGGQSDLYLPVDCGKCGPCRARLACDGRRQRAILPT